MYDRVYLHKSAFNGKILITLPVNSGGRQGYPLSLVLFNSVLEIPSNATKQQRIIECR